MKEHGCDYFDCRETPHCSAYWRGARWGRDGLLDMLLAVRNYGLASIEDLGICSVQPCRHKGCDIVHTLDIVHRATAQAIADAKAQSLHGRRN